MTLSTPCRESFWSSRDWVSTMRREMADYQRGVGQRLKALRQSRQASQETAAHMAGVSTTTWRNWERGLRAPYERNWRKLAQGFKLTSQQIAEIRGEPPTPLGLGENGSQAQLDRIERMLARVLAVVDPTPHDEQAAALAADQARRTREQTPASDTTARGGRRGSPAD